jgi:hypothetical protein
MNESVEKSRFCLERFSSVLVVGSSYQTVRFIYLTMIGFGLVVFLGSVVFT